MARCSSHQLLGRRSVGVFKGQIDPENRVTYCQNGGQSVIRLFKRVKVLALAFYFNLLSLFPQLVLSRLIICPLRTHPITAALAIHRHLQYDGATLFLVTG